MSTDTTTTATDDEAVDEVPPLRFYLLATCGNCDEDIHYGPCLSLLDYRGLPVVTVDMASQGSFHCDHCGADNYTGDLELHTEGGQDPDEDDDESEEDES